MLWPMTLAIAPFVDVEALRAAFSAQQALLTAEQAELTRISAELAIERTEKARHRTERPSAPYHPGAAAPAVRQTLRAD